MEKEDKAFRRLKVICCIIVFISLLGLGFVLAFGVPNFSNIDEQRSFCYDNGGQPMEPSRQTYNEMICVFYVNNTAVEYVARKIENKEWAEHFGRKVGDYCFSCWDSHSCSHPHNRILREEELHC